MAKTKEIVVENRMTDLAELFRIFTARGLTEEEQKLFTKILNNEYDFGYRTGFFASTGIEKREYGKGFAKP